MLEFFCVHSNHRNSLTNVMGWKDEFRCRNFKFVYDHPEQLVLCQWQTDLKTPTFYLLLRMVFFTFFIGIWYVGIRMMNISIYCGCLQINSRGSIFLYYTTWSELFCCVATGSSLLITIRQYLREENAENDAKIPFESRKWFVFHLVIYTLALDSSLSLALGYFGYVYYNEKRYYRGISYVLHLWTGVIMLTDFMLSSMPTHLLHFYLTFCTSILYGTFSWIYYMAGGKDYMGEKYLYEVLNWEDAPVTAVLAILGTFGFFAVVRVLVFLLAKLRDWIFFKCYYVGTDISEIQRTFVVAF